MLKRLHRDAASAYKFVELSRRTQRCIGRTKLVHRLPVACPWCDQLTLVRDDGASTVQCENCSKQIVERDWNWLCAIALQEQERLAKQAAGGSFVDQRRAGITERWPSGC